MILLKNILLSICIFIAINSYGDMLLTLANGQTLKLGAGEVFKIDIADINKITNTTYFTFGGLSRTNFPISAEDWSQYKATQQISWTGCVGQITLTGTTGTPNPNIEGVYVRVADEAGQPRWDNEITKYYIYWYNIDDYAIATNGAGTPDQPRWARAGGTNYLGEYFAHPLGCTGNVTAAFSSVWKLGYNTNTGLMQLELDGVVKGSWSTNGMYTPAITLGTNSSISNWPSDTVIEKFAGNTVTVPGKVYQWVTNTWIATTCTNETMCNGFIGVAVGTDSTVDGIMTAGKMTVTNTDLSLGMGIYVSENAGEFTQTVPTTSGYIIRLIGHAIATNKIYIKPDGVWGGIQ